MDKKKKKPKYEYEEMRKKVPTKIKKLKKEKDLFYIIPIL